MTPNLPKRLFKTNILFHSPSVSFSFNSLANPKVSPGWVLSLKLMHYLNPSLCHFCLLPRNSDGSTFEEPLLAPVQTERSTSVLKPAPSYPATAAHTIQNNISWQHLPKSSIVNRRIFYVFELGSIGRTLMQKSKTSTLDGE